MTTIPEWKHRWFGVWSEYGERYSSCPSIYDFVNPQINSRYPVEQVVSYIKDAHTIAVTSRLNFPDPFDANRDQGSISYKTDGKWLWLDNLADYVQKNGVCIPERWLSDMQAAKFIAPGTVSEQLVRTLEWPPVI